MNSTGKRLLARLLMTFLVTSCNTGTDEEQNNSENSSEHEESNIVEEVCHHMNEGPIIEFSASQTTEDAPDITSTHTRIDITLVDIDSTKGGFAKLSVDEAGDYLIFTHTETNLTVTDYTTTVVEPEHFSSVAACDAAHWYAQYHFGIGSYHIKLESESEESVSLVVAFQGEEHDHDHE